MSAISQHGPLEPMMPPIAGARRRLPAERKAITHKFNISGYRGYITVGIYPNGEPGEIFLRMAKCGSTLSGLLDSLAIAISLGLQHGIPLKTFSNKFIDARYEPQGHTGEEFGFASSIVDYIFRWMVKRFPTSGGVQ
jgi:ribonucleoside-diphosphate reductase alpha chain